MLLPEPTHATKKLLRARVDQSEAVTGARRVALLQRMVVVLLRSADTKALWMLDKPGQQFDDDLTYVKWTYGGVALWELPAAGLGDAEQQMLSRHFRTETRRLPRLCDPLCPQRLWLRLVLLALAIAGAVSLTLGLTNRAVRALGRRHQTFVCLGGFVAGLLALALLECDPALHGLNQRTWPSIAVATALFALLALGAYVGVRTRKAKSVR